MRAMCAKQRCRADFKKLPTTGHASSVIHTTKKTDPEGGWHTTVAVQVSTCATLDHRSHQQQLHFLFLSAALIGSSSTISAVGACGQGPYRSCQ
eukprot:1159094-Pelagomonas_calceolata.AAC.11